MEADQARGPNGRKTPPACGVYRRPGGDFEVQRNRSLLRRDWQAAGGYGARGYGLLPDVFHAATERLQRNAAGSAAHDLLEASGNSGTYLSEYGPCDVQ